MNEEEISRMSTGRLLDEMVEVIVFDAERSSMVFKSPEMLHKNGKIVTPKEYSTNPQFISIMLKEALRKRVHVTIRIDPDSDLKFLVSSHLTDTFSYGSVNLEEAVCKSLCMTLFRSSLSRL